jgi:hypothetical protein
MIYTKDINIKPSVADLVSARNSLVCHPVVEGDDLDESESIVGNAGLKTPVSCGDSVVVTTKHIAVAIGDGGELYLNSNGYKHPSTLSVIRAALPSEWSISDKWLVKSPTGKTWQFVDHMMVTENELLESSHGISEDDVENERDLMKRAHRMVSYYVSHIIDLAGDEPGLLIESLNDAERLGNGRGEATQALIDLKVEPTLILGTLGDLGMSRTDKWEGIDQKHIRESLTRSMMIALNLPFRV